MIKAVIFDCFGVLLGDAHKMHIMEVEKSDPDKAQEIRAINRATDLGILGSEEAAQYIGELLDMEPEELAEEQRQLEVPNRELLAFIATLKPAYKIGLLSNVSSRDRIGIRFEPGELDRYFDCIVTSGEEGMVKPQPQLYEIMATRLGVEPSECVFVDDIQAFCDGARAVGMQAVQFTTTSQAVTDVAALLDGGEKKY